MSFDSYKRVTDGARDVDVSFYAGSHIYIYIYIHIYIYM